MADTPNTPAGNEPQKKAELKDFKEIEKQAKTEFKDTKEIEKLPKENAKAEIKDTKEIKFEKIEIKEHKDAKVEKLEKNENKEHKDAKNEKIEKNEFKEHKDAKNEKLEKNEIKEHKEGAKIQKEFKVENPADREGKDGKEIAETGNGPDSRAAAGHAEQNVCGLQHFTPPPAPDLSRGALTGERRRRRPRAERPQAAPPRRQDLNAQSSKRLGSHSVREADMAAAWAAGRLRQHGLADVSLEADLTSQDGWRTGRRRCHFRSRARGRPPPERRQRKGLLNRAAFIPAAACRISGPDRDYAIQEIYALYPAGCMRAARASIAGPQSANNWRHPSSWIALAVAGLRRAHRQSSRDDRRRLAGSAPPRPPCLSGGASYASGVPRGTGCRRLARAAGVNFLGIDFAPATMAMALHRHLRADLMRGGEAMGTLAQSSAHDPALRHPERNPLAMVARALDALGADYRMLNQRKVADLTSPGRSVARPPGAGDGRCVAAKQLYRLMDVHHRETEEASGSRGADALAARSRSDHVNRRPQLWLQPTVSAHPALRPARPETLIGAVRCGAGVQTRAAPDLQVDERGALDRMRSDRTALRACLIRWCQCSSSALAGIDVRAHVVDRECGYRDHQSIIDYRYARRAGGSAELRATELATETADKCIALARGLGLPFAGIDLKITPDGEVFCFEVNPCPAFSFYESNTGQPIAASLARYLAADST